LPYYRVKVALLEETSSATKLPQNLQSLAVQNLLKNFDEFDGGFGNAPKFPHEAQLLMLINEQMRYPSDDKLNAITTTLGNMASGGIYDIVGGGFHRYATDNAWLFPHFVLNFINIFKMNNKILFKFGGV
jgi:uncharacterized protein YyaL (SSP411 family)